MKKGGIPCEVRGAGENVLMRPKEESDDVMLSRPLA